MLIASFEDLRSFVDRARGADVVGVDAEFIRERTYYPRLCLLQLATEDLAVAVDPLCGIDLSVLGSLMHDAAVTKVFHSGAQDIEILNRLFGSPPAPVFDTQVAATLTGFSSQVSYQDLVAAVLGVRLDKGQRYTDWAARPLSAEQVAYALDDVRYLPALHRELRMRLDATGRTAWIADEFERMSDPATYEIVPEEQYRRVKRASSLDGRALAVLRELAAWRELEAQRRDVPKKWVMSDETLVEIARRRPRDLHDLENIRGLSPSVMRRSGRAVLKAVERGCAVPREQWPAVPARAKSAIPGEVIDLMAAVVRVRAREHGVAPTLLATREDLESFAAGDPESPLASGWRHAMVGVELEGLLRGDVALSVEKDSVAVRPVQASSGGPSAMPDSGVSGGGGA